jgi:hypothetical protein
MLFVMYSSVCEEQSKSDMCMTKMYCTNEDFLRLFLCVLYAEQKVIFRYAKKVKSFHFPKTLLLSVLVLVLHNLIPFGVYYEFGTSRPNEYCKAYSVHSISLCNMKSKKTTCRYTMDR